MTKYIPHPNKIPFEFNRITEFIYLGTNQCVRNILVKN